MNQQQLKGHENNGNRKGNINVSKGGELVKEITGSLKRKEKSLSFQSYATQNLKSLAVPQREKRKYNVTKEKEKVRIREIYLEGSSPVSQKKDPLILFNMTEEQAILAFQRWVIFPVIC